MQLADLRQGQLDVFALEGVLRPGDVPEHLGVPLELFDLDGVRSVEVGVDEDSGKLDLP